MSDKEYIKELCEEMKESTSKMLAETKPCTAPLGATRETTESITQASGDEADKVPPVKEPSPDESSGVEFVTLDPLQKTQSNDSKKNKRNPQDSGIQKKRYQDSGQFKEEFDKSVTRIKEKLKIKHETCFKLDQTSSLDKSCTVDESSDANSTDSDRNSVSSEQSKETTTTNCSTSTTVPIKYDVTELKAIQDKMRLIKEKLKEIQSTDPPLSRPESSSNISSRQSSISKSSTNSIRPKNAKNKRIEKNKQGQTTAEWKANRNNSSPDGSGSTSSLASGNKQRKAKQAQSTPAVSGATKAQPNVAPKFNATTCKENDLLLLTLLTLGPKERDDYLIKLGKKQSLLVPIKQTSRRKNYELDKRFSSQAWVAKQRALQFCYGTKVNPAFVPPSSFPFLTIPVIENKAQNDSEVKKVREPRTFEDEVSFLLNNGKNTDKKDYKKELTLENTSQAVKNSFLQEENKATLVQFVESLVAAGVGYVVEGALRINVNNNFQAFVDDNTRETDVYISSVILRKCAMDGDFVRVFVKHPELDESSGTGKKGTDEGASSASKSDGASSSAESKPKNNRGFVIEILEKRHSRLCVGSFAAPSGKENVYLKFHPRDCRIPSLRIYKQNWPNALLQNDLTEIESVIYQAEILEWHNDVPVGNILKPIGKCGELEAENIAILVEYDLDVSPYSEALISSLPLVPFQIPQEEIDKRTDLRDECIFTIDPLTARDLDDALSCKIIKNGNFEIGVHISDVSYFLREQSELDELVKLRATSVYMVDSVYHMLPKQLCMLCSLLPGEDKLAFSVFWEITPNAKIIKTWFAKTIINSCSQLSYEHAQAMLDNPNADLDPDNFPNILHGYSPNYISRIVNQLQTIAKQLRARRMENGCLKINQPKLTFVLDPHTGKPISYSNYALRTSNEMIEDFMLLANSSVAEFTHSKFTDISILRNHFPPSDSQMKQLAKILFQHGHLLSIDSSKSVAETMNTIIASSAHPDAARAVLSIMMAKPMTRARYFCSAFALSEGDFFHYALATSKYTHFTSPIRRYADCMVHRVLAAALELDSVPSRTPEELSKLTGICNVKKYNAKLAGDASSLLYFRHYMRTVKSLELPAAVLDVNEQGLELVLISTGHVVKASYKQILKVASINFTRKVTPGSKCSAVLQPKDTNLPRVELTLFSKVLVTITLVKDAIQVSSVLPWRENESQ